MTNGLSGTAVKVLTWLVYALIFFLTTITGWQQLKIQGLSNEYVRLERYKSDANQCDRKLDRIENKLDRLIMRKN